MTEAQRALALSCIQNAGEIGSGATTVNNAGEAPCCALGWLLYCAGVPMQEIPRRENKANNYIDPHPELITFYGFDEEQINRIWSVNDRSHERRRSRLLSLISSFPCESETP